MAVHFLERHDQIPNPPRPDRVVIPKIVVIVVYIELDLCERRAEQLHAKARRDLFKMDERVAHMLAFSGKGE